MEIEKLFGTQKESTPEPPKEMTPKSAENRKTLEDARLELELLKIENEKKKLTSSDANTEFTKTIMALIQDNHRQQLEFLKQNTDMKIDIMKLQLGKDNEAMEWIEFLEPMIDKYIPMLFTGITGNKSQSGDPVYVNDDAGKMILNPKIYKAGSTDSNTLTQGINNLVEQKESIPSGDASQSYNMEIEEAKTRIKNGTLSLEDAWHEFNVAKQNLSGFQRKVADMMTFEDFTKQYHNIRGGA